MVIHTSTFLPDYRVEGEIIGCRLWKVKTNLNQFPRLKLFLNIKITYPDAIKSTRKAQG